MSEQEDEIIDFNLDQWAYYRNIETWMVKEIIKARGTSRSSLKRMLKETRKMISKIEEQLFRI